MVDFRYRNYSAVRIAPKSVWPFANRPLSLSGVEIEGENLTRFIYLDESGISASEPVTVVAGLIVRADRQWKEVEKRIQELLVEYVPRDFLYPGSVFHMTDIFSGHGFYKRPEYPLSRAIELMTELVSIPRQFRLPITLGVFQKLPLEMEDASIAANKHEGMSHAMTYSLCVMMAERYLREQTGSLDVARLVAENNQTTRQHIDEMHEMVQGRFRTVWRKLIFNAFAENTQNSLPIRRIIGSVHYAGKDQEIMLQLADAIAFMVRRFYEKKCDVEQFITAMTGNPNELPAFSEEIGGISTIVSHEYRPLRENPN